MSNHREDSNHALLFDSTRDLALSPTVSSEDLEAARDLCEVASANTHGLLRIADDRWFMPDYVQDRDYAQDLKTLYIRAQVQSALWDVFMHLCRAGFIDMHKALRDDIDWYYGHQGVCNAYGRLTSFTALQKRERWKIDEDPCSLRYRTAIWWLAIMLVRAGKDFDKIWSYIEMLDMVGTFDHEAHQQELELVNPNQTSEVLQDESALTTLHPEKVGNPPVMQIYRPIGFWLPYGVGDEPDSLIAAVKKGEAYFSKVEECFRNLYGLTQTEMKLEQELKERLSWPRKFQGLHPRPPFHDFQSIGSSSTSEFQVARDSSLPGSQYADSTFEDR